MWQMDLSNFMALNSEEISNFSTLKKSSRAGGRVESPNDVQVSTDINKINLYNQNR